MHELSPKYRLSAGDQRLPGGNFELLVFTENLQTGAELYFSDVEGAEYTGGPRFTFLPQATNPHETIEYA